MAALTHIPRRLLPSPPPPLSLFPERVLAMRSTGSPISPSPPPHPPFLSFIPITTSFLTSSRSLHIHASASPNCTSNAPPLHTSQTHLASFYIYPDHHIPTAFATRSHAFDHIDKTHWASYTSHSFKTRPRPTVSISSTSLVPCLSISLAECSLAISKSLSTRGVLLVHPLFPRSLTAFHHVVGIPPRLARARLARP